MDGWMNGTFVKNIAFIGRKMGSVEYLCRRVANARVMDDGGTCRVERKKDES